MGGSGSGRRARWAAAAIIALAVALSAHASFQFSPPNDEFSRINSGLAYLRLGDFRMDFATPPLAKYLVAAPLLMKDIDLALDHPAWQKIDDIPWIAAVAYEAGNDPVEMLRLARPPMLLVLVGIGALVFTWSRRLYGPSAAVLSTALFALTPNTLAYAWFANMDFALGLALPLALFTLWRFLNSPTRGRLVLCGVSLGVAFATHLASISLGLIYPCLLILAALWGPRPAGRAVFAKLAVHRGGHLLVSFLAMGLIALLFVWGVYRFEVAPLLNHAPKPDEKTAWIIDHAPGSLAFRVHIAKAAASFPVPGPTFARAILNVLRRTGELGTQGHWWFYIAVVMAKVPLPALILFGWAIFRRPRKPGYDEWFLLVPAAILFFLASRSVYQSGLRNIYPLIPLLAIYAGRILRPPVPPARDVGPGTGTRVAATFGVWLALIAFSVHPYHLSYYNALVGGPRGGIWAAVGSPDLDWGQGLVGLGKTMEKLGLEEVYLATPGQARASFYGARVRRVRFDVFEHPEDLEPGVYAVSTTYVRRLSWLRKIEPIGRVGNVLWLYRLG